MSFSDAVNQEHALTYNGVYGLQLLSAIIIERNELFAIVNMSVLTWACTTVHVTVTLAKCPNKLILTFRPRSHILFVLYVLLSF